MQRAVSYTHLDVYKRQFNASAVSMADYGLEAYVYEMNRAAAALARKVADGYTPVSYTHLDVYKRQTKKRPGFQENPGRFH